MKIHEYQGKQVLAKYGVSIPRGSIAKTVDQAVAAAKDLGTEVCVVKAQIHAGGRGKGGGVKVSKGIEAVEESAKAILGMQGLWLGLLAQLKTDGNYQEKRQVLDWYINASIRALMQPTDKTA